MGLNLANFSSVANCRFAKGHVRETTIQPHGPYLLGGHSLGGIIALKVAAQLESRGERVVLLAIIDSSPTRSMIGPRFASHNESAETTKRWRPWRARPRLLTLLSLPIAGIVPLKGMAQYDAFYWLGAIQARFARRLRPWSGRAIVYVSEDEESKEIQSDWGQILTGQWHSVQIPSSHREMMRYPQVTTLANDLRSCISDALSGLP